MTPATCVQQVLDCQVEPAITETCVYIELQIPLLAVCAQLYTSRICISQGIIARGRHQITFWNILEICFAVLTELTCGRRTWLFWGWFFNWEFRFLCMIFGCFPPGVNSQPLPFYYIYFSLFNFQVKLIFSLPPLLSVLLACNKSFVPILPDA